MADKLWESPDREFLAERFSLAADRISGICEEQTVPELYRAYFEAVSRFLSKTVSIYRKKENGGLSGRTLHECEQDQAELYAFIAPETYAESYANPQYAVSVFGEEAGQLLSMLLAEEEGAIGAAFRGQLQTLTILLELFVQVYNCFEEEEIGEARQSIYWYFHDYSEIFVEQQIRGMICPDDNFFTDFILHADLDDPRSLYTTGLPVGENERAIAAYLARVPEEKIKLMADTYTEGFRLGFVNAGIDLKKKKTVGLTYPLGFERVMRVAVGNFRAMGLEPTVRAESVSAFSSKGRKQNAYSTSVNPQYDFDHREDKALFYDTAIANRRLEVMRAVFAAHREEAARYAGPAVVEVFGEVPFAPKSSPAALHFTEKQQKTAVYEASESGQITNTYIPGDQYSFTIIAWPLPAIGADFEKIFDQTIEINTLDYKKYRGMQECLIDVLNQAETVHISGCAGNRTDLTVAIHPIADPVRETAFENCLADVNIPLGEVFTSPVLEGTNGVLHVSEVFLNGLRYVDLEMVFQEGMIASYTCKNFEKEEENRKFVRDNVLMHHETLPMGEFAIGTNTVAYRMGKEFGIQDRLPILIAEKTGPHFAVGDTCYSHSEDVDWHNPDGKHVVAKENSVSALRNSDPSKAYFNCHTDITIPYNELGAIVVNKRDGSTQDVIRDGLFVVPGAEELNEPLLAMQS